MKDKPRYILLDDDTHSIFLMHEITEEVERKIKEGYWVVIDLETMETINSNKHGLFRTPIQEI